jgi:hypothetical protein
VQIELDCFAQLQPRVRRIFSFHRIPDQKYLIAIALILNTFALDPAAAVCKWIHLQHPHPNDSETRTINVEGFSAGFLTGLTIYRLVSRKASLAPWDTNVSSSTKSRKTLKDTSAPMGIPIVTC